MSPGGNYEGREQSLVKHFILDKYLQRFAHIIGFKWDTISYVDCFSGPWKSSAPDLSDTSFSVALSKLREARDTHSGLGKRLAVRCLFLEKKREAYNRLKAFADQQHDIVVETHNKEMLDALPEIADFLGRGGAKSFAFVFIDPTGWSGFDLDRIGPLLRHRPGEVLINFMTEHIRRFVHDVRQEVSASLRRLFGTDADSVDARLRRLYNGDFRGTSPQDIEDELFNYYAERVREVGRFEFTCPAVVLFPDVERTYFHLIYATRHRKGVEVFKEVERAAFDFQERVRAEAEERLRVKKSDQLLLFGPCDQPPSHRAVELRERYLAAARERVESLRAGSQQVTYDEVWDAAMRYPLVWTGDVREWVGGWTKDGRAQLLGLKQNQRVPHWGQGHVIKFRR